MIEFTVLHTNDFHSSFESMPRVRSLFRVYEREQPPERLLRFDIGDHMDRVAVETEGTVGAANIDVMNLTGYDAAVPGNNEGLTFTPDELEELYGRQAAFPVVATNLVKLSVAGEQEERGWNRKSVVIEKEGVRFGIIGLTAAFRVFYRELGWLALDPVAAAAEEVKRLREQHGAEVIIALSHLGLRDDKRLAEEVPGIDLILGGHTHHVIESLLRIGDTYIGAAGKNGTHVGIVKLEFNQETRRVVSCEGGAMETSALEPERELTALIQERMEEARGRMNREIAYLSRPLPAAVSRESPLGNLLAAALRKHCDAEIGIVNAGQLLGGLSEGPVTARALHAILPSPINPCVMMLRGDRLLQAIEESIQPEFIHRRIFGYGFRGTVLGTLCLDGVSVELAKDEGGSVPKVVKVTVGGEPLQLDRLYRTGTIDMFTFKVGYETLALGEEIQYMLPEFLRDLLQQELSSPQVEERIHEAYQTRFIEVRDA